VPATFMVQPTILITEDDPFTRRLLARCLENEGYLVEQAASGREMHEKLARRTPDLVLLDKALPDEDGLVLLRQIRAHSRIPVVMLSAHADDADRIAGLEMGADDYVSKFWKSEELIARVKSVIRRCRIDVRAEAGEAGRFLSFAGFRLDTEGHTLHDESGRNVELTTAEFRLLCALARAKGRTLSRDRLLDALGHGADAPEDRIVDVLISRLRGKLGDRGRKRTGSGADAEDPRIIRTVPNVGYQLTDR
jgi:two-component system, OmpR family, response regulator